jgi:hypothetical protein
VLPAMIRMASPSDWAKALMAGFGPMNVASMASENSASVASGPALNVAVSNVTSSPRAASNRPSSTPMMAGACVTFGK